ncbi:MAG: restriction endonuclease subunit S [Acetatifactor sp.]|nr:restriction endonuclease subunit S [Acetatifactor sp.]
MQYTFGYVNAELKNFVTVFRGEYITQKDTKQGNIPVILGGQEPAYYIDMANHTGEIVVVARSGASAGFVSYWNEPIFISDGFGYEANEELIMPKYLYYVLKSVEKRLNKMKRGAGIPHISGEAVLSTKIVVPALKEQRRIIDILDRFDKLCNDISDGIPAEIAARQKQYEYYREKLLSFKELA